MDPVLLALGVAVAVAAVVAVSARDARLSTVGLVAALSLGPFVAAPVPDPLGIAARLAGGILAATLLRFASRPAPMTVGSRVGWPAAALGATAGFVAGLVAHGTVGQAAGPAAAGATAVAVAVVAVGAAIERTDQLRLATGLLLLLAASELLRSATLGSADTLALPLAGATLAAVGAAGAGLLILGRETGPPDRTGRGVRRGHAMDDAHPAGRRPAGGSDEPTGANRQPAGRSEPA